MFNFLNGQYVRPRIRFFAPWAKMKTMQGERTHAMAGTDIVYTAKAGQSYANHIEMAGFHCASIVSYGHHKNGALRMMRHVTFPTLRLYPNKTHSSLDHNFKGIDFEVDGKRCTEIVDKIVFDGCVHIEAHIGSLSIVHTMFPACNSPCLVELIQVQNNGASKRQVQIIQLDKKTITSSKIGTNHQQYELRSVLNNNVFGLPAQGRSEASVCYTGCVKGASVSTNAYNEFVARMEFIASLDNTLQIVTPDETLNTMIRYAKIRAGESIFQTKNGLMHSPGGGGYYAALWTNDQCEYVNPLFGYLGYKTGTQEAINCYALYQKYIAPDKALITSIIAEGDGIWHGAKDRGDSAMYAYGASRFLLSLGDKEVALPFLQSIRDCLSYTWSQRTGDGVIHSDSDELENRFESGSANLSTSCIAYDALCSAAYLETALGNDQEASDYQQQAEALRDSISGYFSSTVEGFDTYRYCAEEKKLRSWICMPLTVGIYDKANATADALLSPKLRMSEGLVTRSGDKTFWDRSTLYALKGLWGAGQGEKALELLTTYSSARLLGAHIPYAVEACPEGNQAQLSGESALYVRIYVEGILGYRPTGFSDFVLCPNLPVSWSHFEIKQFHAHGTVLSICVSRVDQSYQIEMSNGYHTSVACGDAVHIIL